MSEIGIGDIETSMLSWKYTARQILESVGTYNAANHGGQIGRYDVMDDLPGTVRLLRGAKLLD